MPTQSPPQPAAPESSGKPAQPSADAPPSGPGAAAPAPAAESTLFHLLVARGWEAELAYTVDQRIRAMTSEIAADGLEPVLAELRQMRETMAGFATKFATKTELQTELRRIRETMATKADLGDLRRELAERETRLVKWVFGALLAQTAVIVGLVTLLR